MINRQYKKNIVLFVLIIIIIIIAIIIIINRKSTVKYNNIINNDVLIPEAESFLKSAKLAYDEIYGEKIVSSNGKEPSISLVEIYAKLIDPNGKYNTSILRKEISNLEYIIPSADTLNLVYGMDGRNRSAITIDSDKEFFDYYAEVEGEYYKILFDGKNINLGNKLDDISYSAMSELTAISSNESVVKVSIQNDLVIVEAISNVNESVIIELKYESMETTITVNVKPSYLVEFNTGDASTISPQIVAYEELVTKPKNPVKDNYKFEGWYSDEELIEMFDFNSFITSDMIIYAKFQEDE